MPGAGPDTDWTLDGGEPPLQPTPLLFGQECQSPRSRLYGLEIHYPMYVISVKLLLSLEKLELHQAMLTKGWMELVTPQADGRIIFVSHE